MKKFLAIASLLLCALAAKAQDEYIDFLYRTMPLPDSLVYSRQWWNRNVEKTLDVRQEMGWNVPEREFKHFVLPLRVNNETLDDFRLVYADSLCARVKGMSMAEAVLEINHWCHERAAYHSSDGRTSAPMATIRYGLGRCGEESVLTVAALRAAGIPARQVYTPRWAHTDDNHAWVEAWVNGKWHFLGACEPEPVLDRGWFNGPVSRAMLLHTNVFGEYEGSEGVISKNRLYTEINVISNYVPTRVNRVKVLDAEGSPVCGAEVEFKIYNYGEFYTVAQPLTDAEGFAQLETGLGDIFVWASKDGVFGFDKASSEYTEITLKHRAGDDIKADFHIVPPANNPLPSYASPEQVAENDARLKKEDEIRKAMHQGTVNSEVIEAFRNSAHNDREAEAVATVLKSISAKDFRDITADVLEDAVSDISIIDPYVLSPRIEMEYLLPFHREIREGLNGSVKTPEEALAWVRENITIVEGRNPREFRIPPIAVWRSRLCDRASLGIFYVAVCRSAGQPAGVAHQDGSVYVMKNGDWVKVDMENARMQPGGKGLLAIRITENTLTAKPEYFRHFTISSLKDGKTSLLDYEGTQEEHGYEFRLDEGDYIITSGTRLEDGSILTHIQSVKVTADKETESDLFLWPAQSIGKKVGKGGRLDVIMAANGEPTLHALQQLDVAAPELNRWEGTITVTGPTRESIDFYKGKLKALNKVKYRCDRKMKEDNLPVIRLTGVDGDLAYSSKGYNTTLAESLSRVMEIPEK